MWAAGALFLAGVAGSALGSLVIPRSGARHARAGFRVASTQVASTLALAINHEQDLVFAVGRRSDRPVAALYIDVDGFKTINDTLGHAAGDELLQEIARRLRDTVREPDTVGRLGGDEFVVIIDHEPSFEACELVASRLLAELRRPVQIDAAGTCVEVTASIGIASGQPASADELLRDADHALYAAKAAGKDRYAVFETAAA